MALMLNSVSLRAEEEARQPVVLVVEDEVLIRSAVAEYLRILGNSVVEAASAAEAIAEFAAGVSIDIVFSDIQMPGSMDGLSLARWISYHHPGVNVVLTSGNSHRRAAEVTASFLPKPYRVAEAARCIRSLLEDPQQGWMRATRRVDLSRQRLPSAISWGRGNPHSRAPASRHETALCQSRIRKIPIIHR
jgi:CheY-like chemotaxis protein